MLQHYSETRRSDYFRDTKGHTPDIKKMRVDGSAFAEHTGLYHEDKAGDTSVYSIKVNNTTLNWLLCQDRYNQSINDSISQAKKVKIRHCKRQKSSS